MPRTCDEDNMRRQHTETMQDDANNDDDRWSAHKQLECWTLPRLQWESSSPPDSGGNTRGRVKYRKTMKMNRDDDSLAQVGDSTDRPVGECRQLT